MEAGDVVQADNSDEDDNYSQLRPENLDLSAWTTESLNLGGRRVKSSVFGSRPAAALPMV